MTRDEGGRSRTHLAINRRLCGMPREISAGRARVDWSADPETAADAHGLVHGGFVFGLADYAAMLAVNQPTVVLTAAETRFLKPVRVGESLTAEALVEESDGAKHLVKVTVRRGDEAVMDGTFRCLVTRKHVLGEKT